MASLVVRSERPPDHAAIHAVNVLAFERPDEADLVTALRDTGALAISCVAELDGSIVGHVALSPIAVAQGGRVSRSRTATERSVRSVTWIAAGSGIGSGESTGRGCSIARPLSTLTRAFPEYSSARGLAGDDGGGEGENSSPPAVW